MIESHITYEDTLAVEPSLDDFVRDNESLNGLFDEAFRKLTDDVVDRGITLRKLCKRLYLASASTTTTDVTGTATVEDLAQRRRCIINVTAVIGNCIFTLKGSDNLSTWETIEVKATLVTDEINFKFNELYKYYRLDVNVGTSVTYSAYLVETSYEEAHQLRFLWMAFNKLRYRDGDDIFSSKAVEYKDLYYQKINDMRYYYDTSDDGDITDDDGSASGVVRLSRG